MFRLLLTPVFRPLFSFIAAALFFINGYARVLPAPRPAPPVLDENSSVSLRAAGDFIAKYWDPAKKIFYCFDGGENRPEHPNGIYGGRYTDFWWAAQLWEMTMDIYEKTGEAYYRNMIGDVFAGFAVHYVNWRLNDFNDDIAWWAMACTRAYDITGNRLYLIEAKDMFDFIFDYWDDECGGGIYWKNTDDRDSKNACINGPAMVIAARLGERLRDESYTGKAVRLFDWMAATLVDPATGKVFDNIRVDGAVQQNWLFSYNFGTFAEGAYTLYRVTGDEQYRAAALKTLDWFLANKPNANGVFAIEFNGDGACFKPIFFHALKRIAVWENNPAYIDAVNRNAAAAWANRRLADGLMTANWTAPAEDGQAIYSAQASAGVMIVQLSTDL